ncbi:unnamed protein product [Brassica oleracea var. botrytis]
MHIPGEGMVPKALAYFKWSSRRAPRCALAQDARHILHRHGAPCAFLNTALNIGIFASITGLWSIVAGDFLDTVCDEDVFLLDTLDDRGGKAARWMGRGCCDGWGGEASDLKKLCCGDGRGS